MWALKTEPHADVIKEYLSYAQKRVVVMISCLLKSSAEGEKDVKTIVCAQNVVLVRMHRLKT